MRIELNGYGKVIGVRNWEAVPRVGDMVVMGHISDEPGITGAYPVQEVRWEPAFIKIYLKTGR